MRNIQLDKILGRLEDLDSVNLTNLVQRLVRERKLLETVFNIIHEGVLIVNGKGLIEYSNQPAKQMIGLSNKDLGAAVLWKIVPELGEYIKLENLSRTSTISSHEIELSYPEKRFVRLYLVPFEVALDAEVVEGRFAVILSDLTKDKIVTDELLEDQKLTSIFMLAAGVAHELGNPLNSINIHLQLIERKLSKLEDIDIPEDINESIRTCKNEVHRLDAIIDNFLNAIRPTPPDLQEVNVYQLLDEVFALQGQELEDLGIEVEILFDSTLPSILADPNQVKQVFFNITKNAMEAMDHGGMLSVTTSVDDEYLILNFTDNGAGIDEETLAHILEPYYSTKPTGHGLGMMIVQRIMRDHGGQLGIESKKDAGTSITLRFPLKYRQTRMLESS